MTSLGQGSDLIHGSKQWKKGWDSAWKKQEKYSMSEIQKFVSYSGNVKAHSYLHVSSSSCY